jgi:Matrixin/IPT/TIG domain
MRPFLRLARLAVAIAVLSPLASAYYYWIYFTGDSGPFTPIPARFNLSSLPNQTIPYLISSQGPAVMMPGDTFNALISQLQAAANVWNGVPTSAARLNFAGMSPMTQPDATPEVDVVFDGDITPGLLAYTQITTTANVSGLLASGATFIPVQNMRVHFWNDLTINQQASNTDSFFLTMVHEFGHSLGLQHTLTSSVMSTQTTAAITKALPLAADDVAGISLLYPANGYPANTGSISGTVLLGGAAVNMASVVALSTSGTAVSAISNPDGTYQINGIPPGQYFVYAHPLPPADIAGGEAYPDNMVPPQDPYGNPFPANIGFGAQFYGGTTDWTQTTQISVAAGQGTAGVNFNVKAGAPAISSVETYGFLGSAGQYVVGEPPIPGGTSIYLDFYGNGTTVNGKVAPGLAVSVMGGPARIRPGSATYYEGYVQVIVDTSAVSSYTPVALAMTLNGTLYVLPDAFSVVPAPPPSITAVNGSTDGNGNATVNIAGSNLSSVTRSDGNNTTILFDGAQATILRANSDGSLTVAAPPATNGYQANVEALAPDSQTSWQYLGSAAPPTFTYGGPSSPFITVSPAQVIAGADSTVEISGSNTNFVQGQTVVGFGSSDITVTQMWVVSPGLIRMNISVNAPAAVVPTTVSVSSGLQLATLSTAFQVQAANPQQITLRTPILNQLTNLAGVPVGGTAVINTSGVPFNATSGSLTGWTLMISNQPAVFSLGGSGQLIAQVPAGILTGPTVVQLIPANGAAVPPVLMQVDPPPPVIAGATDAALTAPNTAHAGDVITLSVQGLADATTGNFPALSAIIVNVAGVNVTPLSLTPVGGSGNNCQLQVTLPANLPGGTQAITLQAGTRETAAFQITIQ